MEKRLFVQLNGNRKVIGILRGYDVSSPLPPGVACSMVANKNEMHKREADVGVTI